MVCGEPAHFFCPDSVPVCLRAECKHVLSKKKHISESSYKQYFSLQSAQIKNTIEQSELRKKRMAEKRKRENRENISCWEKAIKHDHGYDPGQYPYVVVPTNSKKITKLPKRRQKLFREFLTNLINETMSEFEGCKDNKEEISRYEAGDNEYPFESKACSICRGGCCSIGAEHAFLKKETLLSYVSGHPDQKPEQVLAAYMKYLPEKSFKDSCVNHTEMGCSLPRNMRSRVCNDFLCDPLNKLRELFTQKPLPKGVFFISRAQNHWNKDNFDLDNSIVSSVLILNTKANLFHI
jgi:hypothetical protein